MFLDLSVVWDAKRATALAEAAVRFGFAAIAHTVTLEGAEVNDLRGHRCSVEPRPLAAGKGVRGPLAGDLAASLGMSKDFGAVLQLRRATILVTDGAQVAAVNQALPHLRRLYDLIALRPLTEEALLAACDRSEAEILSLALDEKLPGPLRRAPLQSFLTRGGLFEVELAPAIRDAGKRRCLIASVEQLLHATRGHGVFLSSAAMDPMEMRSPHDLANFAAVLGLRGALARASVSDVPLLALQRGALRRGAAKVLPGALVEPAAAAGPAPMDEDED